MAFSGYTEDTDIIASLPDDPNDSGGLSSGELKEAFDQNATNIAAYLNDTLVAQLNSTTGGSSGADNVGYGGLIAADTVKEALDLIYCGGSGTIPPDGTITAAKIVDEAVTLAKMAAATYAPQLAAAHTSCHYEFATASKTFTVPYSGKYLVTLIGNGSTTGRSGGLARKMMYLTKDDEISIVISTEEGGTNTFGEVLSVAGYTPTGGDVNITGFNESGANDWELIPAPFGYGLIAIGGGTNDGSCHGYGCGGSSASSTYKGCCEIIGF